MAKSLKYGDSFSLLAGVRRISPEKSRKSDGYLYGEKVFRELDLDIPKGKITTLIGLNGSGKSAILKTLCRILSPDSG